MADIELEKEFVDALQLNKRIIYKVCYMYASNNDDLNDLYQEVVINLWKAYPAFKQECKLSTWIYRVALNTCISDFRKKVKRPDTIPLNLDMDFLVAESDTNIREMYLLISRLGKLERALILLWIDERPYDEISKITGLSKNNIAVKLNRIREKLRKMSNN